MSARLGRQRRAGSHRCLTTLAAAKADGPDLALGSLFLLWPQLHWPGCVVTRGPSGLTHRWARPLGTWRHEILFKSHQPVQLVESPGSTGYPSTACAARSGATAGTPALRPSWPFGGEAPRG